ncbi:hypothetical protein [Streptomyces sp. NBC_00105]|uniref:hypothetical protein n=1 Tax=Streptomyces sp. NBC_00105 TaxID=2903622 RepID=UPI0032463866
MRIYPEPPAGCYWSSGTLWWTVQPGDVLFFVHHLVRAHNGHREVTAAVVDLHRTGQDLKRVAVPSPSLSRDLAVWQGRWAAVRILRDGRRRPWRAVALDSGRWADHASDLNASG